MGHIISKDGISVDLEKIRAIMEWPFPRNVIEVLSFLGLAGYYKKYVDNFSKVARPMFVLMKKGICFLWIEKHNRAFDELKKRLTAALVLVIPNCRKRWRSNVMHPLRVLALYLCRMAKLWLMLRGN